MEESFHLILESSSSEEEEENIDEGPLYPRDLHPLPVRENYASGDMMEISKDVDSILVCTLTPCSFKSQDRGFTVSLNTARVYRCTNTKLTAYLATRDSLRRFHEPEYRARNDRLDPRRSGTNSYWGISGPSSCT